MIDRFGELLNELGTQLSTTLHVDKQGACKLNIKDEMSLQLECDMAQERLLIATFICEIPPGKFRENILKDALKSNGPFPKDGTLAYSERNNQLTLFSFLSLSTIDGRSLHDFLQHFIEKANQWRQAVSLNRR